MNETKHQDHSMMYIAATIIVIFCTYQFVMTPDMKKSVNQVLSSRQVPQQARNIIATLVTLPTAAIVTSVPVPWKPVNNIQPAQPVLVAPLCSRTANQSNCTLDPTVVIPTPIQPLPQYTECWQGSYYSCEDLAKMTPESRDELEDGNKAASAIAATDAFLATPVATDPQVAHQQEEYRNACAVTPKDQRTGLLAVICSGAGL